MNKLEQLEAIIAEGSCEEQLATIKTSELIGPALDLLVAKCNGDFALYHNIEEGQRFLNLWTGSAFLKYSTLWGCGGPIIEREKINVVRCNDLYFPKGNEFGDYYEQLWRAEPFNTGSIGQRFYGPTPLIAAMRCYVASKLGDVVEVPDELVQ